MVTDDRVLLQDANPSGVNRIEAAYLVAQSYLKRSRLSDVEFIYTPSQIAATCFRMADPRLFQTALDKLLPLEAVSQGGEETNSGQQSLRPLLERESLLDILQHVQTAIERAPLDGSFEMDKVKAADKLVKLAQDPAKNKSSAL
jgi:cyclin H